MNVMYSNIGSKIKTLAKVIGVLLAVSGVVAWIYFITNTYNYYSYGNPVEKRLLTTDDLIGWISLICGLLGFCSSWLIFGFGQLVEDVSKFKEVYENSQNTEQPTAAPVHSSSWICSSCQTENSSNVSQCKKCGNYR